MVLVRIAYAADLPTPDELIRSLADTGQPSGSRPQNAGGASASGPPASAPRYDAPRTGARGFGSSAAAPSSAPVAQAASPAPAAQPIAEAAPLVIGSFQELLALAAQKRDLGIKAALERDVRLVHCEDGRLDLALEPSAPQSLVQDLSRKLQLWTGRRWIVVVSAEAGSPTVRSRMDDEKAELLRGVRADPLVQAVLEKFPGAEIVGVTRREPELPPDAPVSGEPDDGDDTADAGDDRE
jgi:DNA polymerase-3 subunit gamma/tau